MTFSLSFILWAIPAFLLYFTFWSVPCREGQNLPSVHFQGGFVLLHSLLLHHSGVMLIVFHSGCCPQLQKEPFGGDTCPCLAAAFHEVSGIPVLSFCLFLRPSCPTLQSWPSPLWSGCRAGDEMHGAAKPKEHGYVCGGKRPNCFQVSFLLSNLGNTRNTKPDITYFCGKSHVANPLLLGGAFSAPHWPFQPLQVLTKELFF